MSMIVQFCGTCSQQPAASSQQPAASYPCLFYGDIKKLSNFFTINPRALFIENLNCGQTLNKNSFSLVKKIETRTSHL